MTTHLEECLKHYDYAIRWANHISRGKFDAEDIVQETYKHINAALQRGCIPQHHKSYVTSSVRNTIYDEQQKKRRQIDVTRIKKQPQKNPLELLEEKDLRNALEQAINTLPENYATLVMDRLNGHDHQTIAQRHNLSVNIINCILHRARRRLRTKLEPYNPHNH